MVWVARSRRASESHPVTEVRATPDAPDATVDHHPRCLLPIRARLEDEINLTAWEEAGRTLDQHALRRHVEHAEGRPGAKPGGKSGLAGGEVFPGVRAAFRRVHQAATHRRSRKSKRRSRLRPVAPRVRTAYCWLEGPRT